MKDNLIIRIVAKALLPVILLFAFYVQFHGDYSPGGGFQAGVIFSSAFLLHALVYGISETQRVFPPWVLKLIASGGVLLYAGVGVVSLLMGGEYLNYSLLADSSKDGQHIGIILIELGVGMTVASVMILVFITFAAWSKVE